MIDKDTFCEQIRLHEKAMYYLAFSLVQNEADAADVIGEAMLMCDKVTPQYDRQPPLLFRTKGHSIRRVHDFMLYLKY